MSVTCFTGGEALAHLPEKALNRIVSQYSHAPSSQGQFTLAAQPVEESPRQQFDIGLT